MSGLPVGDELEKRARELGVDVQGEPHTGTKTRTRNSDRAPDHVLQQRLLEAERAQRENRLVRIAYISAIVSAVSAIASIVSAVTALVAVAR